MFTPEMTLGYVFEQSWIDPLNLSWLWPAELMDLYDDSLLVALDYRGGPDLFGGARIMFRHAVAGLLNAAHLDVQALDIYIVFRGTRIALSRDWMLMKAGTLKAFLGA